MESNNNNNIEYYARHDRMLRTIAEANDLCDYARHHYRHAAYDLDYSFYNHRVIEISNETMNNAVQQAHTGAAKLKSSFSRLLQDDCLRRQFPVLMTVPTIPDFPQSPRMNCHYRQTGYHQSKESLYRNVLQFIRRCEEICFHQQNVIAAVAAQIQAEMTTTSLICGGGCGEGGRQDSNNDEDYQPNVPTEEQGEKLEPIPFASPTVDPANYGGGGGKGGRQASNNDIFKRLPPNIRTGEVEKGGQLETTTFVSGSTVESINYGGGGCGEEGGRQRHIHRRYSRNGIVRRPASNIPIGKEEKGGHLEPIPFVSGHTVVSIGEGGRRRHRHRQDSNNDISRRPAPNIPIGEEKGGQLEPIPFVRGHTVESIGEGGRRRHRQDSNNDISRRPAPNIPIGEEKGGQLEPIPFVNDSTFESMSYGGGGFGRGGNIHATPNNVYNGYCSIATAVTASGPATATRNVRENENDHGDHTNNNCDNSFSLALGGRDDFLRRRDSLFGRGRSHHRDVCRDNYTSSNDSNTDNDSAFGRCRRHWSDNDIIPVDDHANNNPYDSNDDDSALRRYHSC
jgi:hypothetical protein